LEEDGTVARTKYYPQSWRYIWPAEFRLLVDVCGYSVEAVYGGFERQPLDSSSTEQVWILRKEG